MPEDAGTGRDAVYFSTKQAEEVGFEKFAKRQAALHGIKTIVLDHMRISGKRLDSEQDAIKESCKDIMHLDLGSNLFETLEEVVGLISLLPKLTTLVLDGNRFKFEIGQDRKFEIGQDRAASVARISTLSLSHTLLLWSEIASVLSVFSATTRLMAAGNHLESLGPEHLPPCIEEIDLSENSFLALSGLTHLSKLPRLRKLGLKHNRVGLMKHTSANQHPPDMSVTVVDIDLAHNAIATWSFFDSLPPAYPALKHLRVTGNPLYKDLRSAEGKPLTAADGYMLTMARLPHLDTLNYSNITEKERINADNYYLRQIASELSVVPPEKVAETLAKHPRWKALCEEYGDPVIDRASKADAVDPHSLAARLITINFNLAQRSSLQHTVRSWKCEVPKSFTIFALLGIVGKRLCISPLKLRLVWESGEKDPTTGTSDGSVQWWDSDDDEAVVVSNAADLVSREVELVAGTRAVGSYIESGKANVRVETR